jgi:uncharacterized membrane protein
MTIVYILIYSITFAIICGLLAIRKNRPFMGWFIFGLIWGPLALIILLLRPRQEIKKPSPAIEPKPLIPKPLSTRYITQSGMIAALYACVTILFAPLSYGPIQIRVSEALTILPFITPAAVPGLFIGCFLANIFGGLGFYDIFGGSFITLVAAICTQLFSRTKILILAPIPPIVLNALGVSLYLHFLFALPYWITVAYIAFGQFIACFILGLTLLMFLLRRQIF